jgi:hypothetical protein
MSNLDRFLPLFYLVIATFAVFMAGYRIMAGMWGRSLLMVFVAVFCAYRFHQLRTQSEA